MASGEDQILTTMTSPDALKAAEIHAMRSLVDAINAQGKRATADSERIAAHMDAANRTIEKFGQRIDNMNDRLIRLEEQKHGREIERLREEIQRITEERTREFQVMASKISVLEQRENERGGVRKFFELLPKLWPILVSIIAAMTAWQIGKST